MATNKKKTSKKKTVKKEKPYKFDFKVRKGTVRLQMIVVVSADEKIGTYVVDQGDTLDGAIYEAAEQIGLEATDTYDVHHIEIPIAVPKRPKPKKTRARAKKVKSNTPAPETPAPESKSDDEDLPF